MPAVQLRLRNEIEAMACQWYADTVGEELEVVGFVGHESLPEVGWSPEWKRVVSLYTVRTVRRVWSSSGVSSVPESFRVLMPGGFITIAGINICRAPFEESTGLRPGGLLFVSGELDRLTPDVMTQGHKLRVVEGKMNSRCAFCVVEPELTVDELEWQLREYHDRTRDPRAAPILAREKIIVGDDYMNLLARYDRAIDFYRAALEIDPSSEEAKQKLTLAERRRYVSMSAFASVKGGMKEQEVRALIGIPREDWIKQVVQNNRVYSVWIYPKSDGGASAVYFDNGVVYHTNWNAAAPPQQ